MSAALSTSPSMAALRSARFTLAVLTPGTARSAVSIVRTQPAQVAPWMSSITGLLGWFIDGDLAALWLQVRWRSKSWPAGAGRRMTWLTSATDGGRRPEYKTCELLHGQAKPFVVC